MKKSAKLIVLLAVLAVLVAGSLVAKNITVKQQSASETESEEEKTVVLSIDPEGVESLTYTYDGETMSLVKKDGVWQRVDEPDFPVKQSVIETMLSKLKNVTADKTIEPGEDTESYGLSSPAVEVTVDGKTLQMGNETELDGLLYVSNGDGNVYLTDASIEAAFEKDELDLVQNETIPSMKKLSSFRVTAPDREYEIVRMDDSGLVYSDDYKYFMKATGETDNSVDYITLDTELTETFISKVTDLTWNYCVDWNADDELMASAGLDNPELVVEISYTETSQVDTNMTDSDGNTIKETVETPKIFTLLVNGSYARLEDSRMIYYVGSTLSDALTYTATSELLPDEVLKLDFSDVKSVNIVRDGETISVVKTAETETDENGETDVVTKWRLAADEQAEILEEDSSDVEAAEDSAEAVEESDEPGTDVTEAFNSFKDALTGMTSDGYAPTDSGSGEAELEIVLHRTNERHPETIIAFHRYDSTRCAVTIDGVPTVLALRNSVSELVSLASALAVTEK